MQNSSAADRVAGGIFMLLGVVTLLEAWRLRPLRMRAVVGDDTFPTMLGLALIILGALLAFALKPQLISLSWPSGRQRVAMVHSALAMGGYWLVLPYLGYALSTFLVAVSLFRAMGGYSWRVCLAAATALSLVFYYVFLVWLGMPFPMGLLGF